MTQTIITLLPFDKTLSMLEIKNVIVKNGANVYGLVRNLEG